MSVIRRPHSVPREPEPSAWQHQQLLELVRRRVRDEHQLADYDPVVAMALIATDPAHAPQPALRLQAHREVARYTHPTLKQVEIAGPGGGPLEVRTGLAEEVVDLIKRLVGRPKGE